MNETGLETVMGPLSRNKAGPEDRPWGRTGARLSGTACTATGSRNEAGLERKVGESERSELYAGHHDVARTADRLIPGLHHQRRVLPVIAERVQKTCRKTRAHREHLLVLPDGEKSIGERVAGGTDRIGPTCDVGGHEVEQPACAGGHRGQAGSPDGP